MDASARATVEAIHANPTQAVLYLPGGASQVHRRLLSITKFMKRRGLFEVIYEVTRRAVLVAELAFQCLQLEKDLRPSMDTVLNTLKEIQDEDESSFQKEKHGTGNRSAIENIETDDTVLLKNKKFQSSPNAVTDMWLSSSSALLRQVQLADV